MAMVDDALSKINELRKEIDVLDSELVARINKRAGLALEIRKLKQDNSLQLYDPGREEQIFKSITEKNNGPLYDDDLRAIYEVLLQVMKNFG
jgi:chorismate mutase